MDSPRIYPISRTMVETKDTKTIFFPDETPIQPGQFYMVWIPNIDEIPMSVSYITTKEKGFTFRKRGNATNALFELKKGEKIGIRGPYGNGFSLQGSSVLFVAGGTGIAMMAPIIEKAVHKNMTVEVILAVKTKEELFFLERLETLPITLHITTDDGSLGYKGKATDAANEVVQKKIFDAVYTCGPEKMMKTLLEINTAPIFQASLERYMKCGVGLCGQCCIGKGQRVCVEGPVFQKEQLVTFEEFGISSRDSTGRSISL